MTQEWWKDTIQGVKILVNENQEVQIGDHNFFCNEKEETMGEK